MGLLRAEEHGIETAALDQEESGSDRQGRAGQENGMSLSFGLINEFLIIISSMYCCIITILCIKKIYFVSIMLWNCVTGFLTTS